MTNVEMKPWERRLEDLAYALKNSAQTYFDPNLFRRNVNHFLQTARTVSFIVQKGKSTIQGFEHIYLPLAQEWDSDEVMKWAKNSRNKIEKEGDLELHSTLRATLVFSYLSEDDLELEVGDEGLMSANVFALAQIAKSRFPKGIWSNAAVRVERMWVSEKLPERELLSALQYTYSQLHRLCFRIARTEGKHLPASIPEPSAIHIEADLSRHVEYVRVLDGQVRSATHKVVLRDENSQMPKWIAKEAPKLKLAKDRRHDFETTVDFHALMAEATFKHFGNHIPMVFLYGEDWQIVGSTTPLLADQTDKYFFWRSLGDQIRIQGVKAFVSVAEVWLRDIRDFGETPIRELPIIGECLQLTICSREAEFHQCSWSIERDKKQQPILGAPQVTEDDENAGFIHVPLMRGLGLEPKCMVRVRGKRN